MKTPALLCYCGVTEPGAQFASSLSAAGGPGWARLGRAGPTTTTSPAAPRSSTVNMPTLAPSRGSAGR